MMILRQNLHPTILLVCLLLLSPLWSEAAEADAQEKESSKETTETAENVSEADMVISLSESLNTDEERLERLRAEVANPASAFAKAEEALNSLKAELEELQKKNKEFDDKAESMPQEIVDEQQSLTNRIRIAEEKFKVAFEEQKNQKAQIQTLTEKIAKDQLMLARLSGDTNSVVDAAGAPAATNANASPPQQAVEPAPMLPPVPGPAGSVAAASASQPASATESSTQQVAQTKVVDLKLREAQAKEAEKRAEAEAAQEGAQLAQDRIISAGKEIETDKKLLATAQKKLELATEEQKSVQAELKRKRAAGAPQEELASLERQLEEIAQQLNQAQTQIGEQQESIQSKQSTLEELAQLEEAATKEAAQLREAAEDAEKDVKALQNPFHPRNLLQYLLDRGPKVGVLILLMFVANFFVRFASRRMTKLLVRTPSSRGSLEERENRATTLVSVFQSTAQIVIFVGGSVAILNECGVPVGPLIGGAAIIGLAVAFGAQRLISDFFHGFVMLMENQYQVNDVVKVAGISGLVERITLRVTVLRDLEGIVHFVPNSEIKTVSNMTHGWSRALFDVGIAYKEDADRVMDILIELSKEIRQDPNFSNLILEDAEMLGVDALADSSVNIKFFIKTRPLKQWTVKREMLRRIKRRFDELGIEIPFPHRTLYVRQDSASAEEPGNGRGFPDAANRAGLGQLSQA